MAKANHWAFSASLLFLLVVVFSVGWILVERRESRAEIIAADTEAQLKISSASFSDGGEIPSKFTCNGANISPELALSAPPTATKSLAIIEDDPDAPLGSFVHWIVFNLPPGLHELPEGVSVKPEQLQGARQGINNFDNVGYGGPCPPAGKPHHYLLRVYALDTVLSLPEGATKKQVTQAANEHVLAEGKLVGLYGGGQ